jgi:hypothetical protein
MSASCPDYHQVVEDVQRLNHIKFINYRAEELDRIFLGDPVGFDAVMEMVKCRERFNTPAGIAAALLERLETTGYVYVYNAKAQSRESLRVFASYMGETLAALFARMRIYNGNGAGK